MEKESLSQKSFKGVLWSIFGKFAGQIIGFAIGVILARMIAPEAYGLIAMAMVVIGITSSIIDSGFERALLRKKRPTNNDYSTIFWYNVTVAVLIYIIIYFTAPYIELFFETEGLVSIVRLLSISIVISSFLSIHKVKLTKDLKFKQLNLIDLMTAFLSGSIGIFLALNQFEVWALVAKQLSAPVFSSFIIFYYHKWMPSIVFSRKSFKELFSFSNKLLINSIFASLFSRSYEMIIGKFFAPASLAYFTRAHSYQNMISYNLTVIIQKVSFPVLSEIQDDDIRVKNAYREILRMIAFVIFPVMLGLMAVSEPLIVFLITDKWLPTAGLLQILCISAIIYPLYAINLNFFLIKGKSNIYLGLETAKYIIIIGTIIAGLPYGVKGLVIAKVVGFFIAYMINLFVFFKKFRFSVIDFIIDLTPYLFIAIVMAITISGVSLLITSSLGFLLITQLCLGITIYFGLCFIFKLKALYKTRELIKNLLEKK